MRKRRCKPARLACKSRPVERTLAEKRTAAETEQCTPVCTKAVFLGRTIDLPAGRKLRPRSIPGSRGISLKQRVPSRPRSSSPEMHKGYQDDWKILGRNSRKLETFLRRIICDLIADEK